MEQNKSWWDWPTAILVFLLVVVVAARLSVTNWSPNLWMMDVLALSGVVLGLLLGASKFRQRTVFIIGSIYSIFFIFWQSGLIIGGETEWAGRILFIFERLKENLLLFFNNSPVTDSLLFLFLMALIIWTLAMTAGYHASRDGKPWWPIFFLTVLFLIVDYYHPFLRSRNRYTAVYFFLILLLSARLFLGKLRKKWSTESILEDAETGMNLTKWMAVASLGLILIAWNLPILFQVFTPGTAIQRQWERSWQQIRDRLSNAVAGLTNPVVQVTNIFGENFQFGQKAATGDDLLYSILVPGIGQGEETQYYWKAQSYDQYQFSGWSSSNSELMLNPANDWKVMSESYGNQTGMTFSITSNLDLSQTMIAPGMPINFNRAVTTIITPADEGQFDVLGYKADPPLTKGETYRVQTIINEPTIEDLRNAGEDYPEWIKTRYLTLPASLSSKIQDLAQELTQGAETSFDKAKIVTQYLRKTITYEEEMEKPPIGKDTMEWFLFDYQKGFCNYYASAEVLLLRSVGVPARLSVGFVSGEYLTDKNTFTIRRKNGHAWPEVYFVGIGWVEFEPTTSQPERYFPENEIEQNIEGSGASNPPIQMDGDDLPDEQTAQSQDETEGKYVKPFGSTVTWILVAFFAISIPVIFFLRFLPTDTEKTFWIRIEDYLLSKNVKVPRWLLRLGSGKLEFKIREQFQWIDRIIKWNGGQVKPGMTAAEKISLLIEGLPEADEPARSFLNEYELAMYSRYSANLHSAVKSGRQIRRIYMKKKIRDVFLLKGNRKVS